MAFASDTTVFPGQVYSIYSSDSSAAHTYLWTTSNDSAMIATPTTPRTSVTDTGGAAVDTFHILVTDPSSGCTATSFVVVNVITKDSFVLATAFTPNGDQINPYFYPVFSPNSTAKIKTFRVYNRWGQTVYDNPNAPGWDGNFNGKPQPEGTYMIFITIEYPDPAHASRSIDKSVEGNFQLFR
jgi:gliding motility-associated-like protein